MNISSEFKEIISSVFYDKEIDVYNIVENVGEELDCTREKGEIKQAKLSCNVHFTSNEMVKKDFGLDIEANIMVTCDTTVAQIGDIITYQNQDYTITGKLTPDSHTKLFAQLGIR